MPRMSSLGATGSRLTAPGGGQGHSLTQELMRSTAQIPGLPQTLLAILENLRLVFISSNEVLDF